MDGFDSRLIGFILHPVVFVTQMKNGNAATYNSTHNAAKRLIKIVDTLHSATCGLLAF